MSDSKAYNAIHYICHLAAGQTPGSVRLNKILFLADVLSFDAASGSLTGSRFIKAPYGPMLANFNALISQMKRDGVLSERIKETPLYDLREFASLAPPDISLFTEAQLTLLSDLTQEICAGLTARALSDPTHNRIWQIGEMYEEIPVAGYFDSTFEPMAPERADALYFEYLEAERVFQP